MAKTPTCKKCGQEGHYGINCLNTPRKPIKSTKKRKPTIAQINKKLKDGGNLTKAEEKIQYKKQKDRAWKAFSDWVRNSECLASTGTFERGICVTCNVAGRPDEFPYAKLQAGHAVGGRGNAVLFHEDIVHIQCSNDNRQGAGGLSGDYGNYMTYLVRKYGLEHAESLQRLKTAYKAYSYQDLVEIERLYKEKLEELKGSDKRLSLF